MAAAPFIGIDFGTCNSSAAWFNPRTGQAEVLVNAEGEEKTPSVVYFGPNETVVGRHAEERLESPERRKRVLTAVKRDLAKPRVWLLGDRRVTPVEAATLILAKLKRDAEETHFHDPVERTVITCPAVFDEAEKDKIREAAVLAGFREVELLEEPVAAAVAYSQAGMKVGHYVLVYDLGGGTFDLALLVREDGEESYRLAMAPRGERIGGEDFDRAIYDYFEARIQKQMAQPVCPDGVDLHLLRLCRRFKENLTSSQEPAPLSWFWPGKGRLELHLTRDRLESLIEKPVERTMLLTRSIQEDAGAAGYRVESVILIGGSSRIPYIVRHLHETLQVESRKWQKQDVAVALGAAYHAQQLWGEKAALWHGLPTVPPATTEGLQEAVDSTAGSRRPSVEKSGTAGRPGHNAGPSVEKSGMVGRPCHNAGAAVERSAEAEGLFAQARTHFDEATTVKQEGSPEKRRQHLETALRYAQAACDLEPQWPEPFCLKGRILQEKGEWLLAVAAYTVSLRADPNSAQAHVERGFCKLMAGDNLGAKQDFDEVLRLEPTEVAYRYRAGASLRLGEAAAARTDIQHGLTLADKKTPQAALHTLAGLLLRDQLHSPDESIASFAEALRLLPTEERPQERKQFQRLNKLFGLLEPFAGQPSVRIQEALWQACKASHGGCTRTAAALFLAHNTHAIADSLWKGEPDFALHLASIWAEKAKPIETLVWLKNLLAVKPELDIRLLQGDPWIAELRDPQLTDFLTPKWSFEERHGLVFNRLSVTNLSPFRVTALQVRVQVVRTAGKKDEPIVLTLASLSAGRSHRWDNLFKDRGWFGGNISDVRVTLSCAEGEAKLVGAPPSRPDGAAIQDVLPVNNVQDVLPADIIQDVLPADNIPEVLPATKPIIRTNERQRP
jgi:tetratricopeptide (TPR) repeat protein